MAEGRADIDVADVMHALGASARAASTELRLASAETRDAAVRAVAEELRAREADILAANARDVQAGEAKGLSAAMLDRLRLSPERLAGVAAGLEGIAEQPDPLSGAVESWERPNGLRFQKVPVPIGVIGMIYESRPNVTADAAGLCVKAGNAVILRGGSEAVHSNRAIADAVRAGLSAMGLPADAVQLVPTQDRAAVGEMLGGLGGAIDLIIPRGGKGLVERVQREARVPVLAHLDGLNTTYIHASADADMAERVVLNAKMRRTGICGATETVLVDRAVAETIVPRLAKALQDAGCEVRGGPGVQELAAVTPATTEDFSAEHLAAVANMAVVEGLDAGLAHIARHGSGHTDAIIADDAEAAAQFLREVDSAIVLHNASTQFADGGEFGFGAEIGIATGRLHARGPVGAQHLVTHKYVVRGDGTVRA